MNKLDYFYWFLLVASGAFIYAFMRRAAVNKKKQNSASLASSSCHAQIPASKKHFVWQGAACEWERGHLYEYIQSSIDSTSRSRIKFALILLELDCCPPLQKPLSGKPLSKPLPSLDQQLRSCSPVIDHCIRVGESQFAVLVTAAGPEDAAIVAQKLLRQSLLCSDHEGQEITPTFSIGICHYQDQKDTPELLLLRAEQALCQAKKLGSGYFCFFDEVGELVMRQRHLLADRLKVALQEEELCLHYQPVIALQSRQIVGLEALIRWQHPQEGLITPFHFIPLAEQTGLIVPIGEWVLRSACQQLQHWHEDGIAPMFVAVNVSARQICSGDLVEIVRNSLAVSGLQAQDLELEITESLAMGNLQKTVKQLQELQALGVEASIDDFGTGHSSLSHLKHLPVKKLKIDRSFISGIHKDSYDAAIVASVIDLAHALGLIVVAEGVELEAQYEKLKELGCDYAQGYLFGKPLAVSEVEVMLRNSCVNQDNDGLIVLSENSGVI